MLLSLGKKRKRKKEENLVSYWRSVNITSCHLYSEIRKNVLLSPQNEYHCAEVQVPFEWLPGEEARVGPYGHSETRCLIPPLVFGGDDRPPPQSRHTFPLLPLKPDGSLAVH